MRIIGLMSGTSGDGIDTALFEISGQPPQMQAKMLAGETIPYEDMFRQRIFTACSPSDSRVDLICQLNADIGEQFAASALYIIQKAGLSPDDIDLIASHGQSIWHQVAENGEVSSTFQIGEASVIAERTGITTISNFRPRDVAVGGQGAPLTGYADWLLLRHPEHWRAVQNIGGMGNVTFLPPLSDTQSEPIAFDTGPGNALIDAAVYKLTEGKLTYDGEGSMARRGKIDEEWLELLLSNHFFKRQPPKTTGRELFGTDMARELVAEGQRRNLNADSIVATITTLTAQSIADSYIKFAPHPVHEVILGGGGRHNPSMVDLIQSFLGGIPVLTHEDIGLDSDFKEALVFALLAHETWHNRPGTHPAITGGKSPVVLGQITPGKNYVDLLKQTWCK